MTEEDKAENTEQQEEAKSTKEPDEGATDTTERYGTPTREDIASGNYFADPFASTDQSPGGRYEEGAQEEALTGQEGGQQQGGQQSTDEILQGAQDETQVPEQEVTLESPLEQETARDRFADAGLLPDHSPPGMDELAATADDTGAPGPPTGKEGVSDLVFEQRGEWRPYVWDQDEEGKLRLERTPDGQDVWQFGYKHTLHEDGSTTFEINPGEIDPPPSQSTPQPEPVLGDATDVTEATDRAAEGGPLLGDATDVTKWWNEATGGGESGGSSGSGSDSSGSGGAAGGGVKDPGPEGSGMTPEQWAQQRASYDALLPPELRTDAILQNATGRGPGGGEEVNPTREGGAEYGTSTGAFAGAQDQQHSLVGQPNPEDPQGGTGGKTGSTDYDHTGAIDPGPDAEPTGEMGLTEDNPLNAPPSDLSSLADEAGLGTDEGGAGFGFTYDPSSRQEAVDNLSASWWDPLTPPEGEEEDDTVDDTGDAWI